MWRLTVLGSMLAAAVLPPMQYASAQRKWDGGGGDGNWSNAANWLPDGIPATGDSVLLDNGACADGYQVTLPAGDTSVQVARLRISPAQGRSITLLLPAANTARPGLRVTGTGNCTVIQMGGELRNASGAASGDAILLSGRLYIAEGGRYVHNTARANARMVDYLSTETGTEKGVFRFDVPGTATYGISLSGNSFGTLEILSEAAGGSKGYGGTGNADLRIRGALVIGTGAQMNSTLSANIVLEGDLRIEGLLNLSPGTAGTSGRSLVFSGSGVRTLSTGGRLAFGANFRNIEVRPETTLRMENALAFTHPGQGMVLHPRSTLRMEAHPISGPATFQTLGDAVLALGSPDGICRDTSKGNLRTAALQFDRKTAFHFTGTGPQSTGDAFPDTVSVIRLMKPAGGLQATRALTVTDTLILESGILKTDSGSPLTLLGATIRSQGDPYGTPAAGTAEAYVEGPIVWNTGARDTLTLPVGDGGLFAPIRLSRARGGQASYRVQFVKGPHLPAAPLADPPLERILDEGHWRIEAGGEAAATPTLSWRRTTDSIPADRWRKDLRIAQLGDRGFGTRWESLGTQPSVSGDGRHGWIDPHQPASDLSVLALAMARPDMNLPLTGIQLRSERRQAYILLLWRLQGEADGVRCYIERGRDVGSFRVIDSLFLKSGEEGRELEYADRRPDAGWNWYRIRASEDGRPDLISPVTGQHLPAKASRSPYPVPTHERICLPMDAEGPSCRIAILDASGREIPVVPEAGSFGAICAGLKGFRPGLYVLVRRCGSGEERMPFLVR